ncbi:unnamed protein product [Urochloa humidicola]
MDAVLDKLSGSIVDRFSNLMDVPNDITFLKDELSGMRTLLNDMKDTDLEDPVVKGWSDLAREMVYDIEDFVYDFMNKQESADAKAGFLNKISHSLKTFRAHNENVSEISELKARLRVIHEQRLKRPRTEYSFSPSKAIHSRIAAFFNEVDSLVGIDGPKEEIIYQVDDPSQGLKVLSIVGSGGSGKTTLANAVYRRTGGFDCEAFVSVSQKPTMTTVLNSLLSKLTGITSPPDTWMVDELIEKLREYLDRKRYLIIVDDLWDVLEWNIIRSAFPQNNMRSRVIITTRDEGVARACSNDYGRFMYRMKSLSVQDSRKLFFNRIIGPKDCPRDFEGADEILKKCSGLPLAIITIASILACESSRRNQRIKWEFIKTSLAAQLPTNDSTLEDMMDILDLSYKSLPNDLKQCFLYLGIYPEDSMIDKEDLIRQWVVEGFVRQDMAERYFNELVNRSVIQPEYDEPECDVEGEVIGCKVHDMMLDLILRRCAEDNFITLFHDGREVAESSRYTNIRRLSVYWRRLEDCRIPITLSSRLSHLRCLTMFGTSECIPPWSEFKFLRVLYIEISRPGIRLVLTDISELFLLRSLKVFLNGYYQTSIVLPDKIRTLRYLEGLELPLNSNYNIPSDVGDLPCLSHLYVPSSSSALPEGIGKAKSLRTIRGFCLLESSSQSIEGLGQHTNMEELRIGAKGRYPKTESWMTALSSSLGKLGNLRELVVSCHDVNFCADAMSSCTPSRKLEGVNLYHWTFSRVPQWMGGLRNLSELLLGVMQIQQEDVDMMGTGLKSLVYLSLRIPGVTAARIVISGSTGFSVLKSLSLDWDGISSLAFEAGAMPKLETLSLVFTPQSQERDVAIPAGLQHLSSLYAIYPYIVGPESHEAQGMIDMIERVFESALSHLPCPPDVWMSHEESKRWIEVREDGQEIQVPRITPSSSSPPAR